jgi:hypothetical protein
MTSRSKARITFGVWLGLAAAALVLALLNRPLTSHLGSLDSVDFVFVVACVFFAFVSASVGLVVAGRTHHPIGWLLLTFAVTILVPLAGEQYAFYGLVTAPGSLPMPLGVAWAAYWSFALVLPALVLILMLFPTGTPRSARWRPLVVATPVVAALWATSDALAASSIEWHEQEVVVPIGFGLDAPWLRQLPGIAGTLVIVLFLAAVVSLVLRFRGSSGVERQQMKWLSLVAITAALVVLGVVVASIFVAGTEAENAVGSIGWGVLVTTILLGLPLSIGASILRYRLYDIDRIISRTLSYAAVTALLAGTFALVVVIPMAVVGTGRRPDWLVAAGTLAVAGLFRPVRRRVQNTVDHRFNRKRYDAEHTIEAFTARLREQVDIDALGAELSDVVERTMHPAHVSVWVRNVTR